MGILCQSDIDVNVLVAFHLMTSYLTVSRQHISFHDTIGIDSLTFHFWLTSKSHQKKFLDHSLYTIFVLDAISHDSVRPGRQPVGDVGERDDPGDEGGQARVGGQQLEEGGGND